MNSKISVNVIEKGREINLIEVLNKAGVSVNRYKKSICPFHQDTHPSLSIYSEKNIFKCFVCGIKGDSISFWKEYYKFNNYLVAAADLCYTFNLISLREYESIINKKNTKISSYTSNQMVYANESFDSYSSILDWSAKKNLSLNTASDIELDLVYRLFIDTMEEFHGKKINYKHFVQLTKERHLCEYEIKESNYFTFDTKNKLKIMDLFIKNLTSNNIDINLLKKIPGFYFDKKQDKFLYSAKYSLGIPIQNILGQIIRIQLRAENYSKSASFNKYSWFSSSFAVKESSLFKWGTSSGSVSLAHVPNNIVSTDLVITEGHFKAKKISEHRGCISISVQGVSNWKSIISVFNEVINVYSIKNILIGFDADFKSNENVFKHGKLLAECLSNENFNVQYLVWKVDYGKGIDDVINNGFYSEIKCIEKDAFEKKFNLIKNILDLSLFFKEISLEDRKKYYELLEEFSNYELDAFLDYMNKNQSFHPDLIEIFK